MRLDVSHNFADIGKRLDKLKADIADKVMARTLNKVTDGARGRMATEIAAEFMVKKGEAADNLRVTKASFKAGRFYMQAALAAPSGKKGRGFNLIRFVEKKVTFTEARRRGKAGTLQQLRVKIKRSGGLKAIPGAFIGNNGRTVFIRTGKARLPIKALTTIDYPQMFNTKRVNARVIAYIKERLPIVAQQEINNVLRQQR